VSQNSKIEWTDATWNPVRGCTKISPGCKHCYAETFAERWRGIPGHPYEQGFDLRLVPEKLGEPLKRRKPTTYFVNSMSDLFHDDVPFEYIAAVFGVMAACPQHTFQVLTKRPGQMHEWFEWVEQRCADGLAMFPDDPPEWRIWQMLSVSARRAGVEKMPEHHGGAWPLPNVWLGVSVEDREYGLPRIDELHATPAAVRFLSVEPLLEDLGTIDLAGIDWVIVGGESGRGARPMHPDWARSVRDQCVAAGVPFFFKQWGAWVDPFQLPDETVRQLDAAGADLGDEPVRLDKKLAGRELDGRTWDEMPRRPA
jgi:protein gp37